MERCDIVVDSRPKAQGPDLSGAPAGIEWSLHFCPGSQLPSPPSSSININNPHNFLHRRITLNLSEDVGEGKYCIACGLKCSLTVFGS